MLNRRIDFLLKQNQYVDFINRTNLKFKLVSNNLYMFNNTILINVYGYYTENILYFDIYNLKQGIGTSVDNLENRIEDLDESQRLYQQMRSNYLQRNNSIEQQILLDFNFNIIIIEKYFKLLMSRDIRELCESYSEIIESEKKRLLEIIA